MTLAARLLARLARPVPALEFVGARCLRRRFLRSTCDRCARECPVQALYPGEAEVRIDAERCTGCLACTAVCPSEALVSRDPRPAKLAARLDAGSGPLVLACEKSLRTGRELILPCLGAISREHLAALAVLRGGVTLLLQACRDCHSPWVPGLLQRRRDELEEIAAAERLPLLAIRIQLEPGALVGAAAEVGHPGAVDASAPAARVLADSPAGVQAEDPPGRRDFFRAFRELSVSAAAETWTVLRQEPGGQKEHWAVDKHVPSRVVLLGRAVAGGSPAANQPLSGADSATEPKLMPMPLTDQQLELLARLLPQLEISAECTFCEACVGLCPSGALQSEGDRESAPSSRLLFSWFLCSGCGLCQEFCPARAIRLTSGRQLPVSAAEPEEVRRRGRKPESEPESGRRRHRKGQAD